MGRTCGRSFPVRYGRPPEGTRTEVAPARLEPGRLYLIRGHAGSDVTGAFALSRLGSRLLIHNVDSTHPVVRELRRAADRPLRAP